MQEGRDLLRLDEYNRPKTCEKCDGVMVFMGVGEYKCEDCGAVAYDDYGRVRLYIESHRGATASQIEAATGVKQRSIRNMLKEGRLEVTSDSKVFLHCIICKKEIRSGSMCPECEKNYHHRIEDEQRKMKNSMMQGYGTGREEKRGEKRFKFE